MAHRQRNMEGDANQRRAASREAKAQGKLPSEMSATTGASKQTKSAPSNASHQERMDQKSEGKSAGRRASSGFDEQPRPGNRERDPQRDE